MIVKFKPQLLQVSTHCCSEIMKKNACIQDTTFVSQNEILRIKNCQPMHESFKPPISHVRVENEKMVVGEVMRYVVGQQSTNPS